MERYRHPLVPYDLRKCPYCPRMISPEQPDGTHRTPSIYAGLQTCGSQICIRKHRGWIEPMPKPVFAGPMDYFIYQMPVPA